VFSGGEVSFWDAKFSGGTISFTGGMFVGGAIGFDYAVFSGAEVDFSNNVSWSHPPKFNWEGTPPAGVKLPEATGGQSIADRKDRTGG